MLFLRQSSNMKIQETIRASIALKEQILTDHQLLQMVIDAADACVTALQNGGKVLFCGNGGSAADAQHLAAELSGRYYYDRPPLYAEALHVNSSYVTAVANDYSYDVVFSRMVEAAGRPGDILLALSTSGNSSNVLKAMQKARELGMKTIALTGEGGGKMKNEADFLLAVPGKDTPRIQESHILLGHIICEHIESKMFPK